MTTNFTFKPFGKISRFNRNMVITEKIDGTNGQLVFDEDGEMLVGSRNRLIYPDDDNHNFAGWAFDNQQRLFEVLGPGRHFGEWWGQGIQRRYNMEMKVFSVFNTSRWKDLNELDGQLRCVPVLCEHTMDTSLVDLVRLRLLMSGSVAAPGFPNPEGVMIYHTAAGQMFKYPFADAPKGKQ